MLALTPILLKMTVPATLQWYGGSFVMHLMAGMVLGAVVGRGLRLKLQEIDETFERTLVISQHYNKDTNYSR